MGVAKCCAQAAWITPNDVNTHYLLGNYWLEHNKPSRAIDPFTRAAQLAPELGIIWCYLALANARLFREDQVDLAYEKVLNVIKTDDDHLLTMLARAYRTMAASSYYARREIVRFSDQLTAQGRLSVKFKMIGLLYFRSGRRLHFYNYPEEFSKNTEQQIAKLDELIKKHRKNSKRVHHLAQRFAKVRELFNSDSDCRTSLKAHYDEAAKQGEPREQEPLEKLEKHWEIGNIANALGDSAKKHNHPEEARQWYEIAIAQFELCYPDYIGRYDLYTWKAMACLAMEKRGDALDAALQAVIIDPIDYYERGQLAACHFKLEEWTEARKEWEESLRLQQEEPSTYCKIAVCWKQEADLADTVEKRGNYLNQAADNFEHAVKLFTCDHDSKSDKPLWHSSQFWLGLIRWEQGRVQEGQALWLSLINRGFCPFFVEFYLSSNMLSCKVLLGDAQKRFEGLAESIENKIKKNADSKYESIDDDKHPWGWYKMTYIEMLVWVQLGVASAIAQRQVGFEKALMHVEKARKAVTEIKDETMQQKLSGVCDQVEGEVRLRQGLAAQAIPFFEKAILQTTDADNYLYLATALLDQLESSAADANARTTVMRIKSLLEHAEKLDLDEKIKQPIADLRCRLNSTSTGKTIAQVVE